MECSTGKRLRRTVSATSGGDLGLVDMNVSPPREIEGDDAGFWVNSELALTNSAPKMQDTRCKPFTEFTLTSCNNTRTNTGHVTNGFPSTMQTANMDLDDPNTHIADLQALKDYISEQRGVLGDGWCVKFEYSEITCKTSPIYYAPDGSRYDSMPQVAHHLGLLSIDTNDNNNGSLVSLQNGSHAIKSVEGASRSLSVNNGGSAVRIDLMENGNHGFPLQFEDFFVISIGKVNTRRLFHNTHQIWPIGYKSIWHDKLTGSIFVCNVLEGDDYGPMFRVNRYPCSKQSLPNASTVIYKPKCGPSDEIASSLTTESQHTPSDNNFTNGDVIGEFMVEGRSTSSAWKMVLETLICACRHAFQDLSVVNFHCSHNRQQFYGSYGVDSLDKFSCLTGPVDRIPNLILTTQQLEGSCMVIRRWLEMDRFGLDAEFVQELIERLPGVGACSEYRYLDARCQNSIARTVGSGFFTVLSKCNSQPLISDSLTESRKRFGPPGNTVASNLPPCLIGDVLQVYEFWLRFHKVLGQDAPLSRQNLEKELLDPWVDVFSFNPLNSGSMKLCGSDKTEDLPSCTSTIAPATGITMLSNFHMAMLKVLVEDMLSKVTIYDPLFGAMESKSRKGRKKYMDITVSSKKGNSGIFPINEITWPEVARRYLLVLLSMDDNYESPDLTNREFDQVFHCFNGDGGPLCGSLTGMAAIEADAMILAEASKKIFSSVKSNKIGDFIIDNKDLDMNESFRETKRIDNKCPEWIKVLEPIRRQPTNVGARIRNRVFKSLEKDPPEWAKEMLLRSISKDVYKGNASGPTKKIVVSVLDKVRDETPLTKKKVKESRVVRTVSDVIIKRCRMVLRAVAVEDENKAFFGFMAPNEFDDVVTVSRRLDFRTIDLRLDAGFYDDSHESFIEDVREVWENFRITYRNKPKYLESIDTISRKLEELYKQEVLALVNKAMDYGNNPMVSPEEAKNELNMMMIDTITSTLFIAPWEDGICKICGKDENDHILLLCDRCDSEYHTYCLDPPLQRVPKASWYCPPCISFITSQTISREDDYDHETLNLNHGPTKKKSQREFTRNGLEELADLADAMESMEYWELGVKERVFLLQFLCDESLSSALIQNDMSEEGCNFQKNLLGRDSDGRLYWVLGRPERVFMSGPHTVGELCENSSWVCYESDAEIEGLVEWLEDDDAKEKQLKENIKKWQMNKSNDDDKSGEADGLMMSSVCGTNARAELEKKFGRVSRCDCLEPVGPTRRHCVSCHSTFSTNGGHQCEVVGIIGKRQSEVDGGIIGNNRLSFAPLVGKAYEVLQFLKIILLDIEAALPNEAFRPSRTDPNRLRVWREFLKSAKSIYEMVEATIILEDMIKTDFLRREWRFWSSPSTAAKIPTLSALSLQIYALDAALLFQKPPPLPPLDLPESVTPWNPESREETSTTSNFKNIRKSSISTMELVIPPGYSESKEETPKKSKLKDNRKSSSSAMELVIPPGYSESKEETPKKSKPKGSRKSNSSTMELVMPPGYSESKEETPKRSKLKDNRNSSNSTMELVIPPGYSESKEETFKKSKLKENRKSSSSTMELLIPPGYSESKEETPKRSKLKDNRNSSNSTMELVIPPGYSESKEETPKKSKLKDNRSSSISTMELAMPPGYSELKEEIPKKSKLKDSRKSSSSMMELGIPPGYSELKEETPKKSKLKESPKSSSSTMELVMPPGYSESKEATPKKSKLKDNRNSNSTTMELVMPPGYSELKEEFPKKSKLKDSRKSSSSTMELGIPPGYSELKEETPKKSKLKDNWKSTMELVMPGNAESKEESPKKSKLNENWKSSSSSMVGILNDSEPIKNFIPKSKSRKELDVFNFND